MAEGGTKFVKKWFKKVLCENEIYVFKIFTLSENGICVYFCFAFYQLNTIGSNFLS